MKNFLKGSLKRILSVFKISHYHNIIRYKNILFTHWIKRYFKDFGNDSIVETGLRFWNLNYFTIGKNVTIRRFSNISAWDSYNHKAFTPSVIIGDGCSIGEYFNISAVNEISLGKNVLIGRWVTIIDHSHGQFEMNELRLHPSDRDLISKGKIVIEDDVWIADKVTICSNVQIGRGAVIASNSVVTKDVPAYSMAGGCPAKIIKVNNE